MSEYVFYVEYPEELPLPQSNFSGTLKTPTETTQFTSGRTRRRMVGRHAVKTATLEWLFTPEEYDIWEMFFSGALDNGCQQFTIEMCSGGEKQTGVHVVQCVGDYAFSYEECNWRVSVECILYPYPKGILNDIMLLIFGFNPTDLESILKLYNTRNFK